MSQLNPYDAIPYPSHPIEATHPERLYVIASLFGMHPAPASGCRVLEIGCASGGNLLPMADVAPRSQFVGIDYSARQIEAARQTAEKLNLQNVELRHLNILDADQSLGRFDYIISHGVFSWVPAAVQDKMLQLCGELLAPQGVAIISYNTYPGWRMRSIVRDLMVYHAGQFRDPHEQVRQARAMLDFVVNAAERNAPYGQFLKAEAQMLSRKSDNYLFHDHLEEVNEPIYFYQFVERAQACQLQYLGDASVQTMTTNGFSPEVQAQLKMLASDLVKTEQYLDFLRNRMFRQTLLCRAEVPLSRRITPERITGLYAASRMAPRDPEFDLNSTEPTVFEDERGMVTTPVPIVKAALLHLQRIWPKSEHFETLLTAARQMVRRDPADADAAAQERLHVSRTIMECYFASQMELHSLPSAFVVPVSERPTASAAARLQAESSGVVTNRRHEVVQLDEINRNLIRLLDGKHDRRQLARRLARLVHNGTLRMQVDDRPVEDVSQVQHLLSQTVEVCLPRLAQNALLVN